MNWDAIGAGAELLGAIGVIGTLIYLARQINYNSQQLKGASTVAVHEGQRNITDQLMAQPELFQLILKANFAWDSITEEEKAIYSMWNLKETGFQEMCYHLWKQGALEDSVYQSKIDYFLGLYALPGRRAWWDEQAANIMIDPKFHSEVTSLLNESRGTVEDYLDKFPQFNTPQSNTAAKD